MFTLGNLNVLFAAVRATMLSGKILNCWTFGVTATGKKGFKNIKQQQFKAICSLLPLIQVALS